MSAPHLPNETTKTTTSCSRGADAVRGGHAEAPVASKEAWISLISVCHVAGLCDLLRQQNVFGQDVRWFGYQWFGDETFPFVPPLPRTCESSVCHSLQRQWAVKVFYSCWYVSKVTHISHSCLQQCWSRDPRSYRLFKTRSRICLVLLDFVVSRQLLELRVDWFPHAQHKVTGKHMHVKQQVNLAYAPKHMYLKLHLPDQLKLWCQRRLHFDELFS